MLALSQVRICRPPTLRSSHIYMKDAHSAESYEKSHFRFSFFELWLILLTIYGYSPSEPPTKKKLFKSGQIYRKDVQIYRKFSEQCASFLKIWPLMNKNKFS